MSTGYPAANINEARLEVSSAADNGTPLGGEASANGDGFANSDKTTACVSQGIAAKTQADNQSVGTIALGVEVVNQLQQIGFNTVDIVEAVKGLHSRESPQTQQELLEQILTALLESHPDPSALMKPLPPQLAGDENKPLLDLARNLSRDSKSVTQEYIAMMARGSPRNRNIGSSVGLLVRLLLRLADAEQQELLSNAERELLKEQLRQGRIDDVRQIFEATMTRHELNSKVICPICFEDISSDDRITLQCSHVFCRTCMQGLLEAVAFPTCPDLDCEYELTEHDVRAACGATSDRMKSFLDMQLSRALESMPGALPCPNPDCKNVVIVSEDRCRMACSCGWPPLCTWCQEPWHFHGDCAEMTSFQEQWLAWVTVGRGQYHGKAIEMQQEQMQQRLALEQMIQRQKEQEEDEAWKVQHCKCCPSCGRVSEKVAGCNAMVCGRNYHGGDQQDGCGRRWDWNAGKAYVPRVIRRELPPAMDPASAKAVVANARHFFVTCSSCSARHIQGPRFRCLHCKEVNICVDCDQKGSILVRPGHVPVSNSAERKNDQPEQPGQTKEKKRNQRFQWVRTVREKVSSVAETVSEKVSMTAEKVSTAVVGSTKSNVQNRLQGVSAATGASIRHENTTEEQQVCDISSSTYITTIEEPVPCNASNQHQNTTDVRNAPVAVDVANKMDVDGKRREAQTKEKDGMRDEWRCLEKWAEEDAENAVQYEEGESLFQRGWRNVFGSGIPDIPRAAGTFEHPVSHVFEIIYKPDQFYQHDLPIGSTVVLSALEGPHASLNGHSAQVVRYFPTGCLHREAEASYEVYPVAYRGQFEDEQATIVVEAHHVQLTADGPDSVLTDNLRQMLAQGEARCLNLGLPEGQLVQLIGDPRGDLGRLGKAFSWLTSADQYGKKYRGELARVTRYDEERGGYMIQTINGILGAVTPPRPHPMSARLTQWFVPVQCVQPVLRDSQILQCVTCAAGTPTECDECARLHEQRSERTSLGPLAELTYLRGLQSQEVWRAASSGTLY